MGARRMQGILYEVNDFEVETFGGRLSAAHQAATLLDGIYDTIIPSLAEQFSDKYPNMPRYRRLNDNRVTYEPLARVATMHLLDTIIVCEQSAGVLPVEAWIQETIEQTDAQTSRQLKFLKAPDMSFLYTAAVNALEASKLLGKSGILLAPYRSKQLSICADTAKLSRQH